MCNIQLDADLVSSSQTARFKYFLMHSHLDYAKRNQHVYGECGRSQVLPSIFVASNFEQHVVITLSLRLL